MGQGIIQIDREDASSTEVEERLRFIISILFQLGVPEKEIEPCFPENSDEGGAEEHFVLSVESRIALRRLCTRYNVLIVDDLDGGVKIYVKTDNTETLVAEWRRPWFKLMTDASALERSKRTYFEMHTQWWSIFEDEK